MFFVWMLYFAGQAVHVYFKGSKAVKSSLNGIENWGHYLKVRAPALGVRLFIASMIFGFWTLQPDAVDLAAKAVAGNLQEGMLRSVLEKVSFPLNVFSAGICGYFIDSLLDKVPILHKEIPRLNGTVIGKVKP